MTTSSVLWRIIADTLGDRLPVAIDRLEDYYLTTVNGDDFACTGNRDGYRGAQECHTAALALAAFRDPGA